MRNTLQHQENLLTRTQSRLNLFWAEDAQGFKDCTIKTNKKDWSCFCPNSCCLVIVSAPCHFDKDICKICYMSYAHHMCVMHLTCVHYLLDEHQVRDTHAETMCEKGYMPAYDK